MKISKKVHSQLVEVFGDAVTGSGGTIQAGVDAILNKLDIEIYSETELETIGEEPVESSKTIVVGEELFSFDNFNQWVDKARGWYRSLNAASKNTVAIDDAGRVCFIGKQWMRARDEDTFPVRVYRIL